MLSGQTHRNRPRSCILGSYRKDGSTLREHIQTAVLQVEYALENTAGRLIRIVISRSHSQRAWFGESQVGSKNLHPPVFLGKQALSHALLNISVSNTESSYKISMWMFTVWKQEGRWVKCLSCMKDNDFLFFKFSRWFFKEG